MLLPFDLEIGESHYAIFPEGDDIYIVLKEGKEYLQIQKDSASQWIKFDKETGTPIFDFDEEVNQLGKLIENYKEEPEIEDDEELDL